MLFSESVALNPDFATGHVNSMWALYNSSLYSKCISYGDSIQVRYPDDADIYGFLGDSWSMLNDSDAAIQNYTKAYALAEDPVFYKYQISLEYYVDQDFENARKALDEALQIEPENELFLQFQQVLKKKNKPLAWQIADFVESNYLYSGNVKDMNLKLEEFKGMQDADGAKVSNFIDSIRLKDDIFTFCLSGEEYDWYRELEEGKTVSYRQILSKSKKNIHYFDIEYFGLNTANQFIDVAETIPDKDRSILVLDLLDNGGGDLNSCMEMLDYLLGSCVVGNLIYRDGTTAPYYSDDDAVTFEHIYILVNENTASSSELLTLGLKKYLANVTVIGQPTFGKGVGQTVFESEKDRIAVLLVNFYWNVKEENIMNSSIKPDIRLSGSTEQYLKKVDTLVK